MKVNLCNPEGYLDPTAHDAIVNVLKEQRKRHTQRPGLDRRETNSDRSYGVNHTDPPPQRLSFHPEAPGRVTCRDPARFDLIARYLQVPCRVARKLNLASLVPIRCGQVESCSSTFLCWPPTADSMIAPSCCPDATSETTLMGLSLGARYGYQQCGRNAAIPPSVDCGAHHR